MVVWFPKFISKVVDLEGVPPLHPMQVSMAIIVQDKLINRGFVQENVKKNNWRHSKCISMPLAIDEVIQTAHIVILCQTSTSGERRHLHRYTRQW